MVHRSTLDAVLATELNCREVVGMRNSGRRITVHPKKVPENGMLLPKLCLRNNTPRGVNPKHVLMDHAPKRHRSPSHLNRE